MNPEILLGFWDSSEIVNNMSWEASAALGRFAWSKELKDILLKAAAGSIMGFFSLQDSHTCLLHESKIELGVLRICEEE